MKKLMATIVAMALLVLTLGWLTSPASATGGDDECVVTPDQTVTEWFEEDPGAPWAATGDDRVKTEGTDESWSDWANVGELIRTEENETPPGSSDSVRFNQVGTQGDDTEVLTEGQHWALNGPLNYGETPPVPPAGNWTANATHEPHDNNPNVVYPGTNGLHYVSHGSSGQFDWFYFTAPVYGQDFLWQKQTRTFTPGTDDVMEYEYTKVIEGNDCPDEPEYCPADFDGNDEVPGTADDSWEITWGQQAGSSDAATFNLQSFGGMVTINGNPIPGYMGDPATSSWTWLYPSRANVENGRVVTYEFADGTQITATVSGDEAGCPVVEWVTGTIPEEPEVVQPVTPPVTDPCGVGNAAWDLTGGSPSNFFTQDLADNGVLTLVAVEGYVFPNGESTLVLGEAPETNTEPCPIPIDAPAEPDTLDPCGLDNVTFVGDFTDTEALDYTVSEDGASITVTPIAPYVFNGEAQSVTFDLPADSGVLCPTDQPDPIVTTDSSTQYECGDDSQTVTTVVTITEFVTEDGGVTWAEGEPVSTTTEQDVPVEVVECDKPDEPKNPEEPKEPRNPGTPSTPAVPTSVDAGLPAASAGGGNNGLYGGVLAAMLGLVLMGFSARKRVEA